MPSVLYVEDTQEMQRLYSVGLAKDGFEVVGALSAGEALARVEDRHFDIILLDMMLGGMSGLDFLDTYDVQTKSPGTLVVGFSNIDNPNIVNRAMAHGLADYLVKADYEPKQLADRLHQLLAAGAAKGGAQ
jgi:CheY-like chemotaxis protein